MPELLASVVVVMLVSGIGGLVAGYLLRDIIATEEHSGRIRVLESNVSELWSRETMRDAAALRATPEATTPAAEDEGDDDPGMREHRRMYGDDDARIE